MSAVDFEVERRIAIGSRSELVEVLREPGGPLRLCGGGSQQGRLPAPPRPVTVVDLSGMRELVRLDPADSTCSVQPGLPREELDRALAEHGLWLPCPGTGTIGGLLATDAWAPLAPGALSARSVVLGMEAVLGDGVAFKSGAPVVKSVAGFDLHKLFVGSRGRVCAATLVHLKLRTRPRHRVGGVALGLDPGEAWRRWHALRRLSPPAESIVMQRDGSGWRIDVVLAEHRGHVAGVLRQHGLRESEVTVAEPLLGRSSDDVVHALVPPSRIARVVGILPAAAPVQVGGTGQLRAAVSAPEADRLMEAVAAVGGAAEIGVGSRKRRGLTAGGNPGALALQERLRAALDPGGRLL